MTTYKACCVCKQVLLPDGSFVHETDLESRLGNSDYSLTHGILSKDCVIQFYGQPLYDKLKVAFERDKCE